VTQKQQSAFLSRGLLLLLLLLIVLFLLCSSGERLTDGRKVFTKRKTYCVDGASIGAFWRQTRRRCFEDERRRRRRRDDEYYDSRRAPS